MTKFEPFIMGQSWKKDSHGEFVLPRHSLGYEALKHNFKYLKSPNGGPWKYTKEQARLTLWWYALDDNGRFVYRDSVIARSKGWGPARTP